MYPSTFFLERHKRKQVSSSCCHSYYELENAIPIQTTVYFIIGTFHVHVQSACAMQKSCPGTICNKTHRWELRRRNGNWKLACEIVRAKKSSFSCKHRPNRWFPYCSCSSKDKSCKETESAWKEVATKPYVAELAEVDCATDLGQLISLMNNWEPISMHIYLFLIFRSLPGLWYQAALPCLHFVGIAESCALVCLYHLFRNV